MSWKTLTYSAPLTNTQNFGNEVSESASGTWISPLSFVDMIGSSNFAAQTQDGAVHATIAQQVLQVIALFDVEFRQPCPDLGSFESKSHQLVMSRFPRSVLLKSSSTIIPATTDDYAVVEDEKETCLISANGLVRPPTMSTGLRSDSEYFGGTGRISVSRAAPAPSVPVLRGVSPRRDKG
jgi:hypothetical protein